MDKRIFGVIAIAITALTLGTVLGSGVGQVSLTENPTFSGHLLVEVETESGTAVYEVHNVVTTIGKTHVLGFIENGITGDENATDYISLSNDDTPAAGWTNLPQELAADGLTRAQGATIDVDATSFKVWKKFAATGTVTVQCSGLNWGLENDGGTLWAAATFTSTTLNDGDNITITWTVTHNA